MFQINHIKNYIPDKYFIAYLFKKHLGYYLNLDNPKTFNEKLQWLKLYDRNSLYTILVDKFEVKKYISKMIGSDYIVPTIGIWNRFEDVDFKKLPLKFVLKCTHDSGGLIICHNKDRFNIQEAKEKMERSLNINYYWTGREWPYKNVKPRIIAEEFIADNLRDYKLFCFNGDPLITLVCSERFTGDGLKEDFYDKSWRHLDIRRPGHENSSIPIPCPNKFELMKSLAATLSKDIPFVRVDFYEVNGKVFFGEMTFFPASGFEGFAPEEWDLRLGEWLKLPDKKTHISNWF